MKISIGGDHAGYHYKERLVDFLKSAGHQVEDFGPYSEESADYPDFVHPTASSVENQQAAFGILVCGSGNGVNMTANKHSGVRSALCWNTDITRLARQHNDANIICVPARFVAYEYAQQMVEIFLNTEFEGGRHQRRVAKIPC